MRTDLLPLVFVIGCGCALIFYLWVHAFSEKPSTEPEQSVTATLISKEVQEGTNRSGRSMMGYSFVVNFRTEKDELLQLYVYEMEFGALKEGMTGRLTYQMPYFLSFETKD